MVTVCALNAFHSIFYSNTLKVLALKELAFQSKQFEDTEPERSVFYEAQKPDIWARIQKADLR